MKETEEIVARIQKSGVVLEGERGTPPKKITHSDFIEGFGLIFKDRMEGAARVQEEVSTTPFLMPPNVYLFNETREGIEIGMYHPECTIPEVKFNSAKLKEIRLPNIIISVRLRKVDNNRDPSIKYVYNDARFYATDQGSMSLPSQLLNAPDARRHIWILPLPNIFHDARICFGGNSYIQNYSKDLRTLHYLYKVIYDTPFNGDLGIPSVARGSRDGPSTWIKNLRGLEKFPYEKLQGFNADLHKKHQHELAAAQL